MVLEAVYRMARCLDCTSVHQRPAESASDNGHGEAYKQFQAGAGWEVPKSLFQDGIGLSVPLGSWVNQNY